MLSHPSTLYSVKTMQVKILSFGMLKNVFPATTLTLEHGASVGDLLALLRSDLVTRNLEEKLLQGIAVSVNAEYAQSTHALHDGDEVGLLPPVSGGSSIPVPAITTYLTRESIPTADLLGAIRQPSDGAIASFDGIVRDHTRTRRTLFLDYEAYEEMAATQMRQLAEQAIERFGVRAVTLVHRLGHLEIGETSVLIVVASAHRAAALDTCRWLIDTLKRTVPIWKKETFEDGAVWADGEPFPEEIALGAAAIAPKSSEQPR